MNANPSRSIEPTNQPLPQSNERGSAFSYLFHFLVQCILTFTLVVLVASWAGYWLARVSWAAELLTHFRMQYFILGSLVFLCCFWCIKKKWLIVIAVLTVPHGLHVGSYYLPTSSPAAISSKNRPLRMLSVNVLFRNQKFDQMLDMILKEDADVVVVVEFSEKWVRRLKAKLDKTYPYSTYSSGRIWRGNYVFSKIPVQTCETLKEFEGKELWQKVGGAVMEWDGQKVVIVPAHPASPMNPTRLGYRNWAMGIFQEMSQSLSYPLVFSGDFNCSSGSPYFQDLVDQEHLFDSRSGFGWQGSWPTFFSPASIPIDHVLVSKHWEVLDRKVSVAPGSDHAAVHATIRLKSK